MNDFSRKFADEFGNFPKPDFASKPKKPWHPAVRIAVVSVITILYTLIAFYVTLPPLNFKSGDFYTFLISVIAVCGLMVLFTRPHARSDAKPPVVVRKLPLILIGALLLTALVGSILSAKLFRAASYRDLMTVETGNFAEDITEISFDQIPMLDKDSAEKLGDRVMGNLSDMVSQFEVTEDYFQINYCGRPVRVTPLQYGDIIKWLNNRSEGIPGYIMVDMITQEAELVRLDTRGMSIKYSNSEHFGRNLTRYLRFKYPTYMFNTPNFEIDDNQTPYWVCPVIDKTIGLFGGTDVTGIVLVNASTGECTEYDAGSVPDWIDRVYSADLIIEQYDFHGQYIDGFFNSVFGQKGVTQTTDGYNYLALNDDVYVYTGITSAGGDQSNIGFILTNQRTKETKYYAVAGAEEYSAMSSAEGVVQHLAYKATFPLLLNINTQPTYFMALKDSANLVKMYAMVNVQQYQIVATGATVQECQLAYGKLLAENGIAAARETDTSQNISVSGAVTDIRTAVIGGTTYYYLRIDGSSSWFRVSAADYEEVVTVTVGNSVTITYQPQDAAILPVKTFRSGS